VPVPQGSIPLSWMDGTASARMALTHLRLNDNFLNGSIPAWRAPPAGVPPTGAPPTSAPPTGPTPSAPPGISPPISAPAVGAGLQVWRMCCLARTPAGFAVCAYCPRKALSMPITQRYVSATAARSSPHVCMHDEFVKGAGSRHTTVLGGLACLQVLDLSFNALAGPIPSALWSQPLTSFAAASNALTGTLPDLTGMAASNLAFLNLSTNQMTGEAWAGGGPGPVGPEGRLKAPRGCYCSSRLVGQQRGASSAPEGACPAARHSRASCGQAWIRLSRPPPARPLLPPLHAGLPGGPACAPRLPPRAGPRSATLYTYRRPPAVLLWPLNAHHAAAGEQQARRRAS
jgi:hypothetical protein